MQSLVGSVLKKWFAPSCVLCDAVSGVDISLCIACQQDLPWLLHACSRCAVPLANTSTILCIECKHTVLSSDLVMCALHYSSPVDYLIKRMKFAHQLTYTKVLGELLVHYLSQITWDKPEAILPVPLHKARLRTRGFNQTLELYREVNRHHSIPLLKGVSRIKNTKAQTLVKGEERAQNLQGAFSVKQGIDLPKHVMILDDVITTGATTNTLATLLKDAGVEKISVLAIARATQD